VGVAPESIPEEAGTRAAARAALEGRKKGLLAVLPFLGPAFIACVAYIDPGNFATNIQSGSAYGYTLLWVIALANLMAMLLQTMSAKLGLATGRNLAEMCHLQFSKPVAYAMWIVSEIAARPPNSPRFSAQALPSTYCLAFPCCMPRL
jgi:manganese transport protein